MASFKTESIVVTGSEGLHPLATPTRDLIWTAVRDSDGGVQTVEIWKRNKLLTTLQVWEVPAQ